MTGVVSVPTKMGRLVAFSTIKGAREQSAGDNVEESDAMLFEQSREVDLSWVGGSIANRLCKARSK